MNSIKNIEQYIDIDNNITNVFDIIVNINKTLFNMVYNIPYITSVLTNMNVI